MKRLFAVTAGLAMGLGAYWWRTTDSGPTYYADVAPILQENCQTCHRDGGVGPFRLETYREVHRRRGMIQHVVEDRIMPPWHASPEVGRFKNDRSLAPEDAETLLAWIAAGAPEGDPEDAPEPKRFPEGWEFGEPDAVVRLPEPFPVPAEGVVEYQYTYVPTDFGEDKWIEKMEVRPTDLSVVHHVLVFIEEPGAETFQGGLEGYFAIWVPGVQGNLYPEGAAKLLPAGATLKFQVHYTPNGEPTMDQSAVGIHFAEGPPAKRVETEAAFTTRFRIPPGDPDHEVAAEYTFQQPGTLLNLLPHMHLRGKAFRYDLVHPDGREVALLDVPRYDFNWQLSYELAEPYRVEPGTVVRATAWFDNSADNEFNPDPTATVGFGEQTFHEMMIGYFEWIPDGSVAAATDQDDGQE